MSLSETARSRFLALMDEGDDYSSLAEDAGVTRNAMKGLVTGETTKIPLQLIERFCGVRNLSVPEFLGISQSVDEQLLLAVFESVIARAGISQEAASKASRAALRAYATATRFGVRPDNRPALLSIADVETRELRDEAQR